MLLLGAIALKQIKFFFLKKKVVKYLWQELVWSLFLQLINHKFSISSNDQPLNQSGKLLAIHVDSKEWGAAPKRKKSMYNTAAIPKVDEITTSAQWDRSETNRYGF